MGKDGDKAVRISAAERLTEVAGDLFYRRGIRAVGVDEIVTETGVTKPTLYRNFESKDELVATCLRQQMNENLAKLDAIAAAHADDPRAHLRAIVEHNANELANPDYRGCAVTNAAVEFPEANHPARQVAEECKANLRARVGKLSYEMRASDPEALADGIILLIEGACAVRHTSGSQGPASALLRSADVLLRAYG